jgi:endonuclease YncB( thermonuclease family)
MSETIDHVITPKYHYLGNCQRVVDGDTYVLTLSRTITVDQGFGIANELYWEFTAMFRLKDLDTPETHGRKKDSPEWVHGKQATARVEELLKPGDEDHCFEVFTHKDKGGKYGRYLAEIVFDDGRTLSGILKEEGLEKRESYDEEV